MDHRPPRSARPTSYPEQLSPYATRPPPQPVDTTGRANVSFGDTERGDRHLPVDPSRPRTHRDVEGGDNVDPSRVGRKKSLVKPDREKIEPGHRQWHYRSHAAEGAGRVGVMPSTTGNLPQRETLRRGRSLLAREEDVPESGLALFKRNATLRRRRVPSNQSQTPPASSDSRSTGCLRDIPGPKDAWMIYCFILTIFIPNILLRSCRIQSPEQQRAWREKMGLLSIIVILMAGVGYLTFGFTESVCGKPPNRYPAGGIATSSVIIHGLDYDFSNFKHPRAGTTFSGQTNPLIQGGWNLAGNDASFLFQKVNQNCLGLITKSNSSTVTGKGNALDWYFPCNIYNQYGTSQVNLTGYESSKNCHITQQSRTMLTQQLRPLGQVFYTWPQVQNSNRNLAVIESIVVDLNLLQWLNRAEVNYPTMFDAMKHANGTYNGKDLSMLLIRTNQRRFGHCLQDIATVGYIDTNSIGCVASEVVLYISLVFIIGVVAIRFVMAVIYAWFFSWKLGTFPRETYEQRMQRSAEIENWSSDIYRPAPSNYRPNVNKAGHDKRAARKTFLPSHSRFTPAENVKAPGRPATLYGALDGGTHNKRSTLYATSGKTSSKLDPLSYRQSKSTVSFADNGSSKGMFAESNCPFPLHNVVPQPPPEYEPFNFPLTYVLCLVTAYSESDKALRTTLDSLATTDYPNSHKVILVIADGNVKGAENTMTTPEICLSMMKEFVLPPQDVEAHSYVAIADGHKRHNMAKVFAGFYNYDDATTERSKQQRVPVVLVAKCGNPLESTDPKPGNRGKRDSQIVLMSFLQKVMFDERMTTFEYEFFNSLWRVTGVGPDRYELVLCVDADTKVFPDSLTRMASCMVADPEIMGLCGETKIANKAETFVTMIQVFEYYISHHMTKAFESMFGGVTCLPGCFSMYRIKAPKGDTGYWVPILANPDIVEHYSENVVDTLHKKNLLLLGEDRYLTTLMLKTFPKRKNMFCPQAVCKTVVPDTFKVLISQRRRWINSTIHNLAELLLVRDLCGTFCFSMQFVVAMELAGTLVLPAAISFTLYLIIISIIPGHTNTTIPLVLLAIVLGLPGILIVITSRKVAYVGWMLIYLLSLPIWNGLLPAYAFWHFDDFSWGQTRKVAGDKGGHHGDKEGEFDSSHIVMKRWAEFERDRRWKQTHGRDSFYEKRNDASRLSSASVSETNHAESRLDASTAESSNFSPRPRHDSTALLMLPAPLSVNRAAPSSAASSGGVSRSSEDAYASDHGLTANSNQGLLSPSATDHYDDYPSPSPRSDRNTPTPRNSMPPSAYPAEVISPNPNRLSMQAQVATYDEVNGLSFVPDSDDVTLGANRGRGVSLADNGPVPGPDGVRRVARGRRNSAQRPPQNRYSRNSVYDLPPGAAPPQPGGYSGLPS